MLIATDLAPRDLAERFAAHRLDFLEFPNGRMYRPPRHSHWFTDGDILSFRVPLHELYQLMVDWRINDQAVPTDDIIAVIVFGSAVAYPGYREVPTSRLLRCFGAPPMRRVPIQPADADFLVITRQNHIAERVLRALDLETYDCGTWITRGGIHLVQRGAEQVRNGVREGDTISVSALRDGIPILTTPEFSALRHAMGIPETTHRSLRWSINADGILSGAIA